MEDGRGSSFFVSADEDAGLCLGISRPPYIATETNQRSTNSNRYVVDAFRMICDISVAPEVRFVSSIYVVLKILANTYLWRPPRMCWISFGFMQPVDVWLGLLAG